MTLRTAWRRRLGRACQLLALLALAWLPASRVVAGSPPPPTIQGPLPVLASARPAAGQAVLYDQFDSPSSSQTTSQDSTIDQNDNDTRAADDFFVAPGSNSWQITAVEVVGHYLGGSGGNTANSVNVEFYTDSAGKPGYRLFAASSGPISGTATSGNFYLPLNPAAALASNANYWVSVQAVQSQPTSPYWYWTQRTLQSIAPAVWQNPQDGFSTGCLDWTPITDCFPDTGQDLLFRLYGEQSANQVTPLLISLSPNHGANRAFTLTANGAGFANGAVLNWTIGSTQQFATTVSNASRLSADIPAAAVSSYGAVVSVSVTNPGPCAVSCTSNTLTFSVTNSVLLPVTQR